MCKSSIIEDVNVDASGCKSLLICQCRWTQVTRPENTTHLSSSSTREKRIKPHLEASFVADVLLPSSIPLSSPSLTASFFSLFKPFVLVPPFFSWLALHSWLMIVVKYGLGPFSTPSVYRARVFLKADKMKEQQPPHCILFSSSFSSPLLPLNLFSASFSSSIIIRWIFIHPSPCLLLLFPPS